MYEKFKYFVYFLLFALVFLPVIYLIFSVFFPNFRPTDLYSLWNYIIFSFDPRISTVFLKTVLIAVLASFLSVIIGLIASILIEFTNIRHRNAFKFLLFMPLLIPTYLFTFSWMGFLGKRGMIEAVGFPNLPLDIYNPVAVIVFLSLSYFPLAMLIISLGLKNMDRNLIDIGRLSNGKDVIRKIIIPLIKPHMLISFLFIFVLSISEYTVPAFLRVHVYPSEIFSQLAAFYNVRRAIIYSLPLVLLAIGLSGFLYLYFRKRPFVTISSFSREKKNFIVLSKNQKAFAYSFISLILLLSLLIPIVIILIESNLNFFSAIDLAGSSIVNSLLVGIAGASAITLLGFFVYYFFRESRYLIPLISFPLAISSPVIGIALINLYNSLPVPLYGTFWMIILGYVLRFIPFSVLIFSSFLPQISPSIEESARLCESSFFRRIYRIVLPLTKGGILSSFIIVFIFCLGEVGVTQMVSPPGFQTLSMRIETLMHYGNYSYVASLSLFLLTLIFFFYALYSKVYKPWK